MVAKLAKKIALHRWVVEEAARALFDAVHALHDSADSATDEHTRGTLRRASAQAREAHVAVLDALERDDARKTR